MDRPIKIQEKELTIINQNNNVSFIFNPDYYKKLLDNNCLFDVESVVYNIIRDELDKYGKENEITHPWHSMNVTDDDVLKSTIQTYNIKFKFTDAHFEKFLYYVRFFNEHVINYYKDKLNVHNLWLEDCTHSKMVDMFIPEESKLTYTNPFEPSKIKYLTYFNNTIEYKAKFTNLYNTHFKPYGYEVD